MHSPEEGVDFFLSLDERLLQLILLVLDLVTVTLELKEMLPDGLDAAPVDRATSRRDTCGVRGREKGREGRKERKSEIID